MDDFQRMDGTRFAARAQTVMEGAADAGAASPQRPGFPHVLPRADAAIPAHFLARTDLGDDRWRRLDAGDGAVARAAAVMADLTATRWRSRIFCKSLPLAR